MTPKSYLQLIDTTTPGRCDVTPLFSDYVSFSLLVDEMAAYFEQDAFVLVAGIDALGFILGTALAFRLKKGFLPIRKAGKLPSLVTRVEFVDYTQTSKALELRLGAYAPGARILLVDEWIETGAQVKAAIQLIETQGGQIAGIATINMDQNAETQALRERYKCFSAALDL